jgi:hypothetical protein
VQATESSQSTVAPATQSGAWQISTPLQYTPSAQSLSAVQGAMTHPWAGSHTSRKPVQSPSLGM